MAAARHHRECSDEFSQFAQHVVCLWPVVFLFMKYYCAIAALAKRNSHKNF